MSSRGCVAPFVVLVVAAATLSVNGQVMTSVERRNPNAASATAFVRIAPGPLVEGAVGYSDRTHVYKNVPAALVGAQYIVMSMEDKDNPSFELHIMIGKPGTLYLILDNRVGTNVRSPTATPNPSAAGMAWMVAMGFVDTGMDMAIDENANGSIDNYYSVFSIPVKPGEVVLKAQNDRFTGGPRDRVMYGVAATAGLGKATNPVPANGEQMVVGPVFEWTPGAMAVFHNMYLGTTPQLGQADLVGPQLHTPIFVCTGDLTPGVTYYWRVDEIAADMVTVMAGDVWSFQAASATAFNPVPADGTGWVDPNIALIWKAGEDTLAHDLYFGTDRDAVDRRAPRAFQGTLSRTMWTPPALQLNTVYFWRVDEVAPDGARNAGPVWSFTTIAAIEIGDPNLLAWWRMDEGLGAKVVDWSGHGRHATFGDLAPMWAKGIVGGALQFTGNGDNAVYKDRSFLNGLDALTITAWIKSDVTYTDKGFLIFETPIGNDNMDMRYDADGLVAGGWNLIKMGVTVSEHGFDTILQLESSSGVQTTDWQHVALVWSSGRALSLYLNGKLDSPTFKSAPATGTLTGFSTATIGKGSKDIISSSWQGLIDDLRLYHKALTQEEIQATMKDDSLPAHDPSPANGGSINGGDFVSLTWQAGSKAIAHDVYIGTNQAAVSGATAADVTGIYRGRRSGTSSSPHRRWSGVRGTSGGSTRSTRTAASAEVSSGASSSAISRRVTYMNNR